MNMNFKFKKLLVLCLSLILLVITAVVFTQAGTGDCTHNYLTVYEWADDYSSCKELKKCENCGDVLSSVDSSKVNSVQKQCLTCTTDEVFSYEAVFLDSAKLQTKTVVTQKAWGHDVQNLSDRKPTCTETGLTAGSRCKRCYETIEPQLTVEALGHDTVHHEGKTANCTEDGWDAYETCTRCDYSSKKTINKLGHDITEHEAKAPTCTEDGWNAYETCSRCDYTTFEEIPATGHGKTKTTYTWADDYSKCTEVIACSVCGEELSTRDAAAISTEYISVANCTLDTKIKYKAQFLGDGKTVYSDEIVTEKAWGHDVQILEAQEPNCEQEGLTAGSRCKRCDETIEARETIPPLGHDVIKHEAKAPTCTEAGWEAYETCSRCYYTTFKEVPACHGKTKKIYTWAKDYSKCTEATVCTVCGEELSTRDAAAISTEYISVANCTLDGKIKYKAQFLGDGKTVYSDEIVTEKAWGHNEQILEAKESTCEQEGLTEGKKCSVCDETLVAQTVVAKKEHTKATREENKVEATCKKAGSVDVVTYCSVCNEVLSTETKVIEKLPHKETALKAVAATCTKTGLTAGKKCTVCGTVTVAQKTVTKKAHTNKTTTTKATLTKDGKIETKCSVCGKVSKTTKIAYPKTITLSATKYTYTGKAINPTVTVKGSDGKVIASSNYTVTKKNNTNVGTATVTITFKGNYSGTKTLKFSILPKQVTGLKASKVSTTAVALAWTKVPGAKYYKVEQSTNGKKWTTIGTVTANSLTVKKLKTGAKYQYRVTAMDSTKKLIGKSSAVLKTGTLTAAPTVTLKSTKSKTATASWKKVAGASSYVVYKSTDGKKWTKVGSTTGTSYNLTKLTVGKKIYVKVYAVNAYKQNSAASAVKNVTVKK